MVRKIIMFVTLLMAAAVTALGATRTVGPSDCSSNAVNNAIAAASDGDIVELTCTGAVTWLSTVSIPNTKGITLRVSGGTNTPKTSGNFPLTIQSSADPIINVNCENNKSLSRVSGFKFRNTIASNRGAIYVRGRGTGTTGIGAYRIDNNYFDSIQLPQSDLSGTVTLDSSTGVLTGLVDNNTFHDCSYTDGYTIAVVESWHSGDWSYAGMNAWARRFSFGDGDFAFIEDNLIENVNQYTRHMIMGIQGSKYVVRYNIFDINTKSSVGNYSQVIDAHGDCICSSIGAGARGGEIYNNIFRGTQNRHNKLLLRGGTWLVYNNVFQTDSVSVNGQIALREYRAYSGTSSQCTATCPAQNPWYQSVTDNPLRYPLSQQIRGSYFWNNIYNGSEQLPIVDSDGYQRIYIQSNRDFYSVSNLADALTKGLNAGYGYAAYPYPHPLQYSTIQPPKNLRVDP